MRRADEDKNVVTVVPDNSASHRNNLNPIEQIWSVVKRAISVRFERCIERIKEVFRQAYESAVSCLSFCRSFSKNLRGFLELSA